MKTAGEKPGALPMRVLPLLQKRAAAVGLEPDDGVGRLNRVFLSIRQVNTGNVLPTTPKTWNFAEVATGSALRSNF